MFVVLTGTAGSGKSNLTAALAKWMVDEVGLKISVMNLDPGAEVLPYTPDFDIRNYFTIEEIMKKYKLGPNGAFLKAAELLRQYEREILKSKPVKGFYDYVLVDTPGQLEMFMFRPEGTHIMKRLEMVKPVLIVYVVDGSLADHPEDLMTSYLLNLILQTKAELQVITVVNKVDLLNDAAREQVRKLIETPELFAKEVADKVGGIAADMILDLAQVAEKYSPSARAIMVSARTLEGMKELYDVIHEIYCSCGDLT
ncbi:GTPase [Ignicoccus islandicus DSM 13165]|uniref:GTPase n=1 Tax=Ignicoccus islandicus DSM 13165 TaxID=940295 RepID=A0A0U3F6U6_9CREN|nr:ATP/GTP-binding protein [Ignicoccus islandicus]ALU11353.1 GTPase [Ignicoccus islandicus DSM 13165]